MNRSVLALFERALRVDLRSGQIAIVRTALAGFILVCMWPMQLAFGRGSMGAPGLAFFSTVMWASFVFITLAGLGHFASVIAEEKEVRMLGLLRMTGLSPAAILLGKSTGRLVSALLFLALTLPFALLAVTLGGVGTRQVLAGYVALTAYLVFSPTWRWSGPCSAPAPCMPPRSRASRSRCCTAAPRRVTGSPLTWPPLLRRRIGWGHSQRCASGA